VKICIFGAGAIGGFISVYLSLAGHEVSLISRGPNLAAFKKNGVNLKHGEKFLKAFPFSTHNTKDVGTVDLVFVTVKGPALEGVGSDIGPLLGAETQVIFAMNGIPWWYDSRHPNANLLAANLLDPTGILRKEISIDKIIGCVVDCPAIVTEPGVILSARPTRGKFMIGSPRSVKNTKLLAVSNCLEDAGMESPIVENLEEAIWSKLIVNLSRSPLAVLTGVNELVLAHNKEATAITKEMIIEAHEVAASHGIEIDLDWDRLLKPDYRSEHRSSMLQDWDSQRPMEIDSILKIVCLFAKESGIKTPTMDRILALLAIKAAEVGLYAG
tara:strand:- start:1193 stop:2173 length:981 start_codon:yes stop_codon:yes gene_type:complete